jgi:hypothetical protein
MALLTIQCLHQLISGAYSMATQTQLRRGTAAQNNSFTGAVGELSYDTENKSIRVHDGSTAGGIEVITEAHTGGLDVTGTITADGLTIEGAFNDTTQGVVANFDSGNAGIGSGPIVKWTNDFAEAAVTMLNTASGSSALTFQTMSGSSLSERMRIDSSGNVGISNAAPAEKLHIKGANPRIYVEGDGSSYYPSIRVTGVNGGISLGTYHGGNISGNTLAFLTGANTTDGGTERMRITAAGGIQIGTASAIASGDAAQWNMMNGSSGVFHSFRWANTTVGSITINGSAVAYNTSSDYRLKTDVQPMSGASARVQALNPVNFEWIADGTRVDGFLAHEAQAVVPECVTGTKDAMRDEEYTVTAANGDIYTPATVAYVDEDGNVVDAVDEVIHSADAEQPETLEDGQQWRETTAAVMGTRSVPDMQGIDQSKMVPLLVAALQEALARITALEAG